MSYKVSSQNLLAPIRVEKEHTYSKDQSAQSSNNADPLYFGGYDEFFVDTLPNDLKCPVCFLVLRHPIQIEECGHRFCESCFNRLERQQGILFCPLDRKVIDLDKIFLDKAANRAILSSPVKCRYFERECDWVGDLRSIDNHITSCAYVEVACPNECKSFILRKDLSCHLQLDCEYRIVECQYCWKKCFFNSFQNHLNKCPEQPIECVNKCGKKDILRVMMNNHVENDCPLSLQPCQFLKVGCVFKGTKDEQKNHAISSTELHLSLAVDKVNLLEITVSQHEEKINNLKNLFDSIISSGEFVERSVKSTEKRVSELEKDIFNIENKCLSTLVPSNNAFIWSIDNIASRISKDHKSSKEQDICSSPFYSAPFGYKLFLQIYLNGYGEYRGKSISLFLHIMKGEYDNLLDWPFTKTIKMSLLDQSESREHKTFIIDPHSNNPEYFTKPVSQSKRVGCIIPHRILSNHGLTMDNTIMIKCEIQP
ncbi:TNF receptor-associated factor 4 isoform X1 [Hydra vulgaris]|uniref:TNF receptor-associated factor 4 isoform X1 n=1 Tax=Hydra vulgaris TaxID=6087 RepID=UPI000640EE81|nr:TNF receptor-associated factor 4 [Hydra vulgaris]